MPSNATDTPSWVANVQRPNNGELADAASLSQGFNPITQRSRWLYERSRSKLFDVTRAPYNANFLGVADAQPAIEAAASAANAAGGVLIIPGGAYRLDAGLTHYPGLHILGDPGRTTLLINHATANVFNCSGASSGAAGLVDGIMFEGLVANTGNIFYNPGGVAVRQIVRNCMMNHANLQGRFFYGLADSHWRFDDCDVTIAGTGGTSDAYRQDGGDAKLTIRGGKITLPNTYSSHALYGIGGWTSIDGTEIVNGGGASARSLLQYNSTTYFQRATNLLFTGGNANVFALSWVANVQLVSHGHQFDTTADVTPYSSAGMLSGKSRVELLPHRVQSDAGTSVAVLNKGYRAVALNLSSATAPTLTLSDGLYDGQPLTLLVRNTHGTTAWVAQFLITGSSGALHVTGTSPHPTLPFGNSCKLDLIWSDMFDPGITWSWVVVDKQFT